MIPNNNLSVLPWYTSLEQQNARKWWVYNRIYPLYVQGEYLPPFQIMLTYRTTFDILQCRLIDAKTGSVVYSDIISNLMDSGFTCKQYPSLHSSIAIYPGTFPAFASLPNGQYYIEGFFNYTRYYSEIFTVVNDIEPYLKIEWWDLEDFLMDAGVVVYNYANGTQFKNRLYLPSDLAKPEYNFEEEVENRDGYAFPIKQISEKRYRFNFLASEYMLDVMRFIRMADFAEVTYHGRRYSLDSFLITPSWEAEGDVAVVEAEFETATVAKKLGVGYIKSQRGDFNDDFNIDFNND